MKTHFNPAIQAEREHMVLRQKVIDLVRKQWTAREIAAGLGVNRALVYAINLEGPDFVLDDILDDRCAA